MTTLVLVLVLVLAVVLLAVGLLVERFRRKQDVRLLLSCIAKQSADDMTEISDGCGYLAHRIGQLDRRIGANHAALARYEGVAQ